MPASASFKNPQPLHKYACEQPFMTLKVLEKLKSSKGPTTSLFACDNTNPVNANCLGVTYP